MKIVTSKQVGDISYMTASIDDLYNIVLDEEILSSRKLELNPKTMKKQYYVAFSRDYTSAAKRNSHRWRFGVIIDGDKLSNVYNIQPYSYLGTLLTHKGDLRVKYLVKYDDNTYYLNLVNWSTVPISESVYESIADEIDNLPRERQELWRLSYLGEGKIRRNGKKISERYLFDTKTGGLRINMNRYPELCNALLKLPDFDETEERIWLTHNNEFVNIHSCIVGLITPRIITEEEQSAFDDICDILDLHNISYKIVEY